MPPFKTFQAPPRTLAQRPPPPPDPTCKVPPFTAGCTPVCVLFVASVDDTVEVGPSKQQGANEGTVII